MLALDAITGWYASADDGLCYVQMASGATILMRGTVDMLDRVLADAQPRQR
jgi:hypothetical protein